MQANRGVCATAVEVLLIHRSAGCSCACAELSYCTGFALSAMPVLSTLARFRIKGYPALWRMLPKILVVTLFEQALKMKTNSPLDLLYLGSSIAPIGLALYFTHAAESHGAERAETKHGKD